MIWLTRNTTVLDYFHLKNGKFTHVLHDQVTQCLDSLTINLHMVARAHNTAHVNQSTRTYFILKQTAYLILFVSQKHVLILLFLLMMIIWKLYHSQR